MGDVVARYDPEKFKHRELTERIIGVFYDVYNELGFGFLESVYHRAMFHALTQSGLRPESEVRLPVFFSRERGGGLRGGYPS